MKKFLTYCLIGSLFWNNVAFATHQILELDFKDSQTPQRLHVIPRMSNVGDVSHVEIDQEQQQVVVHKLNKADEGLSEQSASEVLPVTSPIIIPKHDVQNLPWELESEKLTLFVLNHNAWLIPLDEDGYKLEFRGGLLGGMKPWQHPDNIKGGWKEKDFWWDPQAKQYIPQVTVYPKIVYNVPGTGGGGGSKGTSSGGSGWQGILGQGWAKIKENGDKARDRMQKQQENLKKLSTVGQSVEIYKRPEIIIPESPFPRVQPYQPSTKEPFQTGPSVEAQYSRLRVLYNMADRWEWWEIYQYAKIIGVSRDEIAKYKLTQRHAKKAGFSWEYFKEVTEEEERNALKKKQQEEEEREKARQYEEESSRTASSLFDNVPPQYKVTPEYFTQSASDAGMRPSQALNIILNPTPENFYDRTILTSRQNWLGGAKNTIAFIFEDLTNEQAYKYLSQGYHKGDFPTLSENLVSQNGATLFENVKPEDFLKQAEKAKMTSIQALGILVNPTPENFYDRVMLTSRQSWLGGAENTMAFGFEGLTNEQAYKYIADGYKPQDFPTLSNRLVSQRGATLFEDVTPDYFVKQAEKTGMTPMQSLAILMNPTLENAYERVLLASRQNYLGGTHDLFVFRDMGITVGEAYDHLSTHIKNKESFSQLLDDSTNKAIKEGFTQFCREKQEMSLKEEEVFLNSFEDGDWGEVVQLIPIAKMQKTDPMSPYDFFDLEGKMGGSGMMAGGAGGGKLGWNRLFANQKKLSEQQIKTANNVIQKIQHRTRLQLQEKGILDKKGNLTSKATAKENIKVVKEGKQLDNPNVVKELTKDGSKIEEWSKVATKETIALPNGKEAQVHFYRHKSGKVNTNIDFKLSEPVPIDKGYELFKI